MSKRETAIELIHSNRCMINSCLAKEELKQFNGDFAEYIIRQLSILRNQDKKAEEAKKSASILKMPCSETSVSATLEARKCRPTFIINTGDCTSKFRCRCSEVITVHHDSGIFKNNDAPRFCKDCGVEFDWRSSDE